MELTNHIKERYAERIAGRDTTIDIKTYVAQNDEKIEKDISKLYEHSRIIYQGVVTPGKDPRTYRISGTWLLVFDITDRVGVTLYKIDFGLDEDFNKKYIEGHLKKLDEDLAALNEKKEEVREEVEAYKKAIADNEALISEFEANNRRLKKDNAYYKELIENKNAEYFHLELKVRGDVDALTARRTF